MFEKYGCNDRKKIIGKELEVDLLVCRFKMYIHVSNYICVEACSH